MDEPRKVVTLHLPMPVDMFVTITQAVTAEWPDATIRDGETIGEPQLWTGPLRPES